MLSVRHFPCTRTVALVSAVTVLYFWCFVGKNLFIVRSYSAGDVRHTAVADLNVVTVEDLMKFVVLWEVFVG